MNVSTFTLFLLKFLAIFIGLAYSWGDLGHRTVGYLSEKYMNPDGLAFVNGLIQPSDSFDISDGAIWADRQKRSRPYTSEWHYIDALDDPPTDCKVNYPTDCTPKGCVVSAILNMTSRLFETDLDDTQHQEAVKFLLHFLGDIHQPLHTENKERGGNDIPITWKGHHGEKYELHAAWDNLIPEAAAGWKRPSKDPGGKQEKDAAQKWADELFEEQGGDPSTECSPTGSDGAENLRCVLTWASEANAQICNYVLNPDPTDSELFPDYCNGAAPIVKDLLGKAARRFANMMNSMAGSGSMIDQEDGKKFEL